MNEQLPEGQTVPLEPVVGPDAACKAWWDAVWIGDGEHGQYVPDPSDKRYDEYVTGLQIARGAWMEALSQAPKPRPGGNVGRYSASCAGVGRRQAHA